jgi:hypothetical protein
MLPADPAALLRTGLSEQLYEALNVWLRRWLGGLFAHKHRLLRRILGDLGIERCYGRHHGVSELALL